MNHVSLLKAFALAASLILVSHAADPIEGTWTWVQTSPNGGKSEPRLTLKREGDTLTGKIKTGDRESEIKDGKITSDGQVSFVVERVRNDWKFIAKYDGKFDGKTIVGNSELDFNGDQTKTKWVAERYKEPTGPQGNWRWTFQRSDGNSMDFQARFREDNGLVTGTVTSPSGAEMPIEEGKFANDVFTFKIVRERDGRKFTSIYSGKVEGDNIVGQLQTDWSGETKNYDWKSARVKRN
ncbi:MAG TPA: hypothetical protein VEH27_02200 [Methylomirabilota bacterium]|nr:hypothetical protein [Methylomirabilota bacterium]